MTMDTKTIIIAAAVAFTNIGTIIVVAVTLWKTGKLMREYQEETNKEQKQTDDSWHSWRLWLPQDGETDAIDEEAGAGRQEDNMKSTTANEH